MPRSGSWCLLLIIVVSLAAAPVRAQSPGTCGPAQIGLPCASEGPASQADSQLAFNLGAGNPVHIVTGNKTRHDTDLPAAAHTPGLEIVRYYNALDPRSGPLGRGWSGSYDTRLHLKPGLAQIVQADGNRIDFDLGSDPHAGCAPRQSGTGSLTRTDAGWDWRWPDGRLLVFDTSGRLARIVRPSGGALALEYEQAAGPLHGLLRTVRDDSGDALSLHYEVGPSGARLARVATPQGAFTYTHRAAPDGRGWLLTGATRPDGMQRRYHYDSAHQNGHVQALTGAELADADGHVLALGNWSYDPAGRVISVSQPAMRLRYVQTPGPNQPGLTAIDTAAGTTLLHTQLTGTRYLLTDVSGPGCPACPAPGLHARYDDAGRLTSLGDLGITYDPKNEISRLDVPHSGWPALTLTYQAGQLSTWSSSVGGEQRRHDPAQRTLERLHANGDRWTYRYDPQGRPIALDAYSIREGAAPISLRLAWRGDRLTRVQSFAETEWRRYDAHGRLAARRISRPPAPGGGTTIDYEDRYRYDAHGHLTWHRLPEGGSLRYHWQDEHLAAIDWTDAAGRNHAVLRASAPGQPGYVHSNGLRTVGWTQAGRLAGLRVDAPVDSAASAEAETDANADPASTPVFAQLLSYDARGRIARETLLANGRTQTRKYAYDAASRLIVAASDQAAQRHYAWHADGSARHVAVPERDASGLVTQLAGYTVQYDALHRVRQIWQQRVPLLFQRHDAQGRRILRQDGIDIVHYLYADNRLAAEARTVKGVTGITRRYIHVGWLPVAMIDYDVPQPLNGLARPEHQHASLYAIHADAVGLPRLVTDQAGQVRWHADFDALGRAERIDGDLTLELRLPGQVYDRLTGWHDNGLRTYDPSAGHYLQADPLGPLPGTQAFGYAAQQPRRHADPLGLLLFAFDGTRNVPETLTNVWLLGLAYAGGAVHYHPGPGQDSDWDAAFASSAHNIVAAQWDRLLADLSAVRFSAQSVPIDLLGFSRGAALARHFSNQIAEHVRRGRFWARHDTLGTVTACVDLRFMGLFDTVAQFGLSGGKNKEYNLTVSDAWHWVAHAVALHEHRQHFPLSVLEGSPGGHIVEAPFVGAHGDIGGGYLPEAQTDTLAEGRGDLSHVALNWMRWQARAAGVPIDELPANQRTVRRPLVHDERPTDVRGNRYGTREVLDANSDTLLNPQGRHPRYGTITRDRVARFLDPIEGDEAILGNTAFRVDMAAYRQWLATELGFTEAPNSAVSEAD